MMAEPRDNPLLPDAWRTALKSLTATAAAYAAVEPHAKESDVRDLYEAVRYVHERLAHVAACELERLDP